MIVHVVLVTWKEWISTDQVGEAKATFLKLASEVPGIRGAYWGEAMPGGTGGFKNGVVVLADSPEVLAAYHAHPDHEKLSTLMRTLAVRMVGENLQT